MPISKKASKSLIDRAGRVLSRPAGEDAEDYGELESIFDEFRKGHLQPISETTLELQQLLQQDNTHYLIAQRLKRKPQILRKLRRLSVRLTQLQDIGGARIVVEANADVDRLVAFILSKLQCQKQFKLVGKVDYRARGRDDSGYRAYHLILERAGFKLELQLRSRIQHYWAERIERTSVIYGKYLKELEGDPFVVQYFKTLSDLFYEIESGRRPTAAHLIRLTKLRDQAEQIIQRADTKRIFNSFVNEGIVKTLVEKEKRLGSSGVNNWLIVFDWNSGTFVNWDIVARNPDEAIRKYVESERTFPSEDGFEVVLVGASQVATIRETHSHYFGLEGHSSALETLDESIAGFSSRMDLDIGARQILLCMHRKRYWGKKAVSPDTLRNHYCMNVFTFDASLDALIQRGFVQAVSEFGGLSLSVRKKAEIEKYV